jgi:hypothetical protein
MSVTPGSADYENQQVRTPNRVSGTHRARGVTGVTYVRFGPFGTGCRSCGVAMLVRRPERRREVRAIAMIGADLDYYRRAQRGELDLRWLRDNQSEWGVKATPSRVGLTLRDISIGTYGEVPDHAPCPIPCHTVSASSDGSPSFTQPRFRHRHTPKTTLDAPVKRLAGVVASPC